MDLPEAEYDDITKLASEICQAQCFSNGPIDDKKTMV